MTAHFTGVLVGITGSQLANITVTIPPTSNLSLTSGVVNVGTITPSTLQITLNSIIQPAGGNGPSLNPGNTNLNSFTANVTGGFTATAVPEPGSVVLFGIGLSTAALVTLRRKSRTTPEPC